MIDLELTPKIGEWLDTEPDKRNLAEGAELLLRVTKNRILYANVSRNLQARASTIEYNLKKIYKKRLEDITHQQVKQMMVQVNAIDSSRGLSKPQSSAPRPEFQRGKRADHDQLPAQIQQLYVDNADIMRRMRDLHTKLRLISPENSTCPDSDRFPFAKEIIALDNIYRDNWNTYDHYIKGTPVAAAAPVDNERTKQKNAAKLCSMLLGKYAKNPSEELADRIRDTYATINLPSDKLKQKMQTLKLI